MRVHILAKELNVPSKVIIDKCKAEGIDSVKNHMSTLSAGLHATICEWFTAGSHESAVETARPVDIDKVRIRRRRVSADGAAGRADQSGATPSDDSESAVATAEHDVDADFESADDADEPIGVGVIAEPPIPVEVESQEPSESVAAPETVTETAEVVGATFESVAPAEGAAAATGPTTESAEAPSPEAEAERRVIAPAGPQNVPAKAKLQGPRVVRYEAPERDVGSFPRAPRGGRRTDSTAAPSQPAGEPGAADRAGERRRGRGSPRRGTGRVAEPGARPSEWRDQDLIERRERLAGATGRRIHRHRSTQGGPNQPTAVGPKTTATVHEPVRMKEFCGSTGVNFMQCIKVLRDEHNILANVNMTLPNDTAQLLALNFGIDLEVIPAKTRLDTVREEFAARERAHLAPRPPVVTFLGHVDHGKTSLLDAIRKTRVAAREDGGITQHIGAYSIETKQGSVTFLDTPGHGAFTAMRARGAQLTDVVVLVVAADDGLMPQTIEAINHAKAASVPIIVALNKIDLGDQNKLKIYGQLSEHGLTPSGDWGGDVDVLPTSATKGTGVRELVEHLAELNNLLDLKADPTLPATGAVVEAEMKSGVGAVIRLLVQEGTLRVGDVVVCGPACGKVRALLNDRGLRINEAGPACPVEVWGLDDVPTAGDKLYVVDNMQRAKDIATEMKQTRVESARIQSPKVRTLEQMLLKRDAGEVRELNVVIKADVDGSVAALRQALGEIPSDEVRLVVRHAGVGAVTDSDILLAAACEGLVVAFRVDTPAIVRRLADHHGVEVRPYRVIYDACDDVKKALEGLLEPEEKIENHGKAEVRQIFHLGKKIGVIAGSYVTEGTIERSHLAKIIRNGVIVREGCKFGSLRRFKDDVREVRAGLECGIRLDGFDDLHVGDIVESYVVLKIARTL